MNFAVVKQQIATTPAFVLDAEQVLANLQALQALRQASGCKILYSMKALPLQALLVFIKDHVDGISVSSLFEARLAREVLGENASVHLTTPGLRPDEFAELGRLCSHISFNSISQFERLEMLSTDYSRGLRINPKLSFVADVRYDPCRRHSKLGIDIELMQDSLPADIEGLHFHTVFGHGDFAPLIQTILRITPLLNKEGGLKWLNLGGGYRYDSIGDQQLLIKTIRELRLRYGVEVYIEPGKAVVGNAGYLLTTVLDRFESDGKTVLVLDTSVNHHPEVFEYQIKPPLLEENLSAEHSAILAGSTCLAGDLFGEYRFQHLPKVGDKLLFSDVGAYTQIKACRFNGYNLPDIYMWQGLRPFLYKRYSYENYRQQWVE